MLQTQDLPIVPMPETVGSSKSAFEALKGLSIDDAISNIANGIVQFSFKLLIAIVVFYLGKFVIKKIYSVVYSIMVNRKVDASLTTFVLSLIRMVLYFILIITIIGILGIETSSFLALFASAGVAIGMALSGTLQNFAGGVLILLLKPYKVGDYIEAQGFTGSVKEIQIFHTVINTPDNKSIIIPNGGLSTGSINNYSKEDYRRVDWSVGLSYGNDFAKAKEVIMQMLLEDADVVKTDIETARLENEKELEAIRKLEAHNNIAGSEDADDKSGWWKRMRMKRIRHQRELQEKLQEQISINEGLPVKRDARPFVGLNQLGDSAIVLAVRAWTKSENYWPLYFRMNERFYAELPEKGFSFPFPQMDVHIADVPKEMMRQ